MEEKQITETREALLKFFKLKIEFEYEALLKEFLQCNIFSNEKDFIQLEIKRVEELINGLEKEADFFFMEEIETDEQYESIKARDHYWYYKIFLEFLTNKQNNPVTKIKRSINELSAFEIAIREWYLIEAKKEDFVNFRHVGLKYKHLADPDNIAKSFSRVSKKGFVWKPNNIEHLLNVRNTLNEYPNIQKAIDNNIDRLK